MSIDLSDDRQVLFATVWGEARGESLRGQQAVAAVVVNRANYAKVHARKQFGDGSIYSACLAPWQFSCWNENDPNRPKMLALNLNQNDPLLAQIMDVAEAAIAGTLVDPTGGANFYKAASIPWPKEWGTEVPPLCVIGHQQFYCLA